MMQGRGIAAGWLNWAYADTPTARDNTRFSGLVTEDGKPKVWGEAFRELAKNPAVWATGRNNPPTQFEFDADRAIVTFGSCTGPVREGLARAAADGVKARLVSLRLLAPLPANQLVAALDGVRRVLVIEQNHTAQLYKYLRGECDLPGRVTSLHRAGALQYSPGEIHRHLIDWSRT